MSDKTKMTSESIHFADLFFKGRFEVPWHQRYYDWTKDQVADLLRDFDDAMEKKQDFYFLGSILLTEEKAGLWGINDGQQRMTTYTLICARFASYFGEDKSGDKAMHVVFDLDPRKTRSMRDVNELKPRLKPSRGDEIKFNSLIREEGVGTNGKLTQAWAEIDKFVSALDVEKAKEYCKFLIENVEVSLLTIPSTVDPNMIFETLNFRGKTLEDFDLIRNHFYSFFNKSSEESKRGIVKSNLEDILRNQLGSDKKIKEYARCYLQCEYGFLPKQKFYRSVRDNIERAIKESGKKRPDHIFDLIARMADGRYIQIFNAIARSDTIMKFIDRFNVATRQVNSKRNIKVLLDEMRNYTVTQPILLALLSRHTIPDLDDATRKKMAVKVYREIKRINAFVMRTALVTGKFEPSRFESDFADLACKIFASHSIDELEEIGIWERLKQLSSGAVLDDKSFVEALKTLEISRSTEKAKRFLYAINADMQSDADTISYNQVTLEHILPQGAEHWDGWDKFIEDEPSLYAHRIGNLTLLSSADNNSSKQANAKWKAKQGKIAGSMFALNKQFSDIDDWSPEEIDKRQEELAKRAAEIWAF